MRLLQGLTPADTLVPHVPFERFLESLLISFGLDEEDKQVPKLALAIARKVSLKLLLWPQRGVLAAAVDDGYAACLLI